MPNSVPTRRMRASMSSRCTGSSPSVGSSSSTSCGSWAMAWASFTRWRWPVDMVPIGPEALLAQPDLPERVAGPAGGLAVGEAVDLGDVADEVVGGGVGRQGVVLGGVADPLAHRGAGADRVEAEHRAASPRSGRCRPSIMPSRVVLPAPLVPSSPVTPRWIVKLAPSSAR